MTSNPENPLKEKRLVKETDGDFGESSSRNQEEAPDDFESPRKIGRKHQ